MILRLIDITFVHSLIESFYDAFILSQARHILSQARHCSVYSRSINFKPRNIEIYVIFRARFWGPWAPLLGVQNLQKSRKIRFLTPKPGFSRKWHFSCVPMLKSTIFPKILIFHEKSGFLTWTSWLMVRPTDMTLIKKWSIGGSRDFGPGRQNPGPP